MAFIEKTTVAAIRAELKRVYPDFKFSVTRERYSTVRVVILASTIDFFDDTMRVDGFNQHGDSKKLSDYDKAHGTTTVNEFWINDSWRNEAQEMFLNVVKIIKKHAGHHHDRNAGDYGADYPDYNYHMTLRVGDYDKPYKLIDIQNQQKQAA